MLHYQNIGFVLQLLMNKRIQYLDYLLNLFQNKILLLLNHHKAILYNNIM